MQQIWFTVRTKLITIVRVLIKEIFIYQTKNVIKSYFEIINDSTYKKPLSEMYNIKSGINCLENLLKFSLT